MRDQGWVPPNTDYPPPKAGEPPLHEAARLGDDGAIERLVAGGAHVDALFDVALDPSGRRHPVTPLQQAAGSGDGATARTVRLLLDLDATLEHPGSDFPALWYACSGMGWNHPPGGDADRVATLLAAGDDPTWTTPDRHGHGGTSLIARAARTGDSERVRLLLAAGADPDPPAPHAWPLHEAVRSGSVETVRLIIDHGVEVNRPSDRYDDSLLSHARTLEMLETLLGAGARIITPDELDDAPHEAEQRPVQAIASASGIDPAERSAMVRSLVQNLALGGEALNGALHRAAFSWNPAGVQTLLEVGADPTGEPRLLAAACFGCTHEPSPGLERVIDLLVEAGLDPNDQDDNGFSPLHTALSPDTFGPDYQESDGFNAPAALALLRHGASADIVFPDTEITPIEGRPVAGFTGLHVAALHGSSDVVHALLAHGADPSLRTPDGLIALDLARSALAELTDPGAWTPRSAPDDASPSRVRRAAEDHQRWADRIAGARRCLELLVRDEN